MYAEIHQKTFSAIINNISVDFSNRKNRLCVNCMDVSLPLQLLTCGLSYFTESVKKSIINLS